MEREREAALLQHAIEPHIGVVVDLQVAHRGDHETGHVLAAAEGLDLAHAGGRIGERQAQHGIHAAARLGQHLLSDPAVVGPAEIRLHLLLRMHADVEHAGWEQAGVVHAHRIHPALAELYVAMLAILLRLLGAPQRIARHAPAHVLDEARISRHDGTAIGNAAAAHGPLPEYVVL